MKTYIKKHLKRIPGLIPLARAIKETRKPKIIKKNDPLSQREIAQNDLQSIRQRTADTAITCAVLEYRAGNYTRASRIGEILDPEVPPSPSIGKRVWKQLGSIGRWDLALSTIASLEDTEHKLSISNERVENIKYFSDAYKYYKRFQSAYSQPDPKGYVIIFDLGSRITTGLMVPISLQLFRMGYEVCSAVDATMPKSSLPELDGISALIRYDGQCTTESSWKSSNLQNSWEIDWDSNKVVCDGVNYHTFFIERLSKLNRSYRGRLDTPESQKLFHQMLTRSDLAILLCKRLVKLSSTEKPIRLVSMDTHFAPWGVIRRWCDAHGKEFNIHLIALSIAYENYFSNLTTLEASTISVENMTVQPHLRHPFLGGRYRFEKFVDRFRSTEQTFEKAKEWICINRSQIKEEYTTRRNLIIERITTARAAGKMAFLTLGKVLIDFAAPDDSGHVFDDFQTWINHLISLSSTTGAIVLIKPHPHELRPEIVQQGVQKLRDLLPATLPETVIFLEHDLFNSYELAEYVDAALVWNGTALAELPVLGCPVIAESIWAERDYPLNSDSFRTLEDYEGAFQGIRSITLSDDTRSRAASYLHFLKSEEVAIPFKYVKRAGTNQSIGSNAFYDDQIAKLDQDGDPYVQIAANRFFEF